MIDTPTAHVLADVKEARIILNVLYKPSSLSTFTYFEEQERFE
jgi:hypothetical protein